MRCILLKYNSESKGYKLMDPTSQNIYITKDVIFDEIGEYSTSPFVLHEYDNGPIINYDDENDET